MPEYLAPGVFVEEVSFRQKTIEGVSTSTTGFVGPTRFGPTLGEPELLTSFADFERIYGGLDQLAFADKSNPRHNYLAHAVRAYFEEGGKRLYVARTYDPPADDEEPTFANNVWSDGRARHANTGASPPGDDFALRARHPGAAGNFTVTFVLSLSDNILDTNVGVLLGASNFETVWAQTVSAPNGAVYWLERFFDDNLGGFSFRLRPDANSPAVGLDQATSVQRLTASVITGALGRFGDEQVWEDLTFHPEHRRSLSQVFAAEPSRRSTELFVPLVFESDATDGATIASSLLAQNSLVDASAPESVGEGVADAASSAAARSFRVRLTGGSDGNLPIAGDYEGDVDGDGLKSALKAFEDLEDISIVAAPGVTFDYSDNTDQAIADATLGLLISHCERMRYRIAVLDTGNGQLPSGARQMRNSYDSTRAAFYYPWVRIADPVTEGEIYLPPSGFVAGIYARTDVDRGVHKAPANEVVRLATGFETLINKGQQEVLNPAGVNCLRFFEGRGYRVWGARTATSDPEWKYVNVRRYFAFLERSIEKGTQWAVFEPNGEILWANVQQTVSDFLFNEWMSNHLLGTKPEQAFFVRCDRSTMTQNDIDNGRLVCLIGVAPLRPAEFVIFRIGQKTADSQG